MPRETLILVDGSSYLYRAYHALPSLATSRGEPTGAIHGVVAMLRRLIKDYQPTYMAVVFDPRGKTTRDAIYPEYKANRVSMPDELADQFEPLRAVVEAMGIPLIVVEGVEADDVIGTLAVRACKAGIDTVISTGDKDMAQLVCEGIVLVNTMDNTRLDSAGVERKFGVPPERMVDYLTLIGDAIDNIPGVPKVGPKTAVKWLAEYQTLDGVLAAADQIGGKVGENLRSSIAHLPLSRQLITIDRDVELSESPQMLALRAADRDRLIELYRALEFKTWLGELLSQPEPTTVAPPAAQERIDYECVLTWDAFEQWLERIRAAPILAFHAETNSPDYMLAEIVGVSFAVTPGQAAYVPLAHDYPGAPAQIERARVLAALTPILEDPALPKLGHNLKYDCSVLRNHGITLRGIRHDSMLESYVLDSTATRHDLDALALKYLGINTVHLEDVAGKGVNQVSFDRVPISEAVRFSAEEVDVLLRLHDTLWPRVAAERGLKELYETIEMPLVPVLSRMERNGVLVDADMLRSQSRELTHRITELEEQAYREAGQAFNLGSPKQIEEVLFDKLALPIKERTPTGQPSTAESVLQELALDYPLPRLILDHRALSKLKSTYTDKLPAQVNPCSGRVHTSYRQAIAATGRLSSSDPNLQNIPIRTEEGRRIRQAFVAPPGSLIVAADYSQIELRIMAQLSGDEILKRAFASGEDIHRATAAEVLGIDPEQVSAEQRRAAKAVNFGLIYGMSAFGLARQLGIDRTAAQGYVDRYFERYPGVKAYMDRTRARAHDTGFVETLFNRRLYLPEINSRNRDRRQYAERTAINAPMQGTAADIIKRAMLAVDDWLLAKAVPAKLIMQVHDELVLEVESSAVAEVSNTLKQLMAGAADLSVPLVVDVGTGANWDEAH